MRLLASFVMRGRMQATMAAAVLALLSLLLPPVTLLSAAVVALVTLRKGLGEGALLIAFSTLACGLLPLLAFGAVLPMVSFVLLMWLPVWLLSGVLHSTRSLGLTLQVALLMGLVVIAAQYSQGGDPVASWREALEPFTRSLVEAGILVETDREGLLQMMSVWMPGLIAAGFLLQSMASLLLARWWQSTLYNPGGFRSEFHQLRVGRPLAWVTLLVLGISAVSGISSGHLLAYISFLLIAGWFLQGLAVVHGIVGLRQANAGWLIGTYALLLLAMPHVAALLALVGFADAWLDLRARLTPDPGSGGAS